MTYSTEHITEKSSQQSSSDKCLKIALVGGSNSVMRDGYTKYIKEYIAEETDKYIELSYFALGGVSNLFGVIQNYRYNIAINHDVILFEYCVNDRSVIKHNNYTPRMAGMALEGFIRQVKMMNPNCVIVILIFGTNISTYYNNCCQISATYESIARRYEIPVIDVTETLLNVKGIKFIKSLYKKEDPAHYTRPKGARIVGKIIADKVLKKKMLGKRQKEIDKCYRMYAANLQHLKFFSNFDLIKNQNCVKKSTFKNSLFEEDIYTIEAGCSVNLKLKGRLFGIVLKSDWYDGLFKIKLGEQELITSSFSKWIKQHRSNINLLSLPYSKFKKCDDFSILSISVCNKIENYDLDVFKVEPKVSPEQWKLSIIGIAYAGEIEV